LTVIERGVAWAVSLFVRGGNQMITQIPVPIDLPYETIQSFCEQWNITEFALFGSVLRDDFRDDSDIDVLVSFADNATITLFDMIAMADELETIFNRKIDLMTKRSIEQSENFIRRDNILKTTQVIYAS
jgi:uncharacterized protein